MKLKHVVQFYRGLGFWAAEAADCAWYRVREGFLVRVPHHITRPPAADEVARLLRSSAVLGLRYSLPPGQPGQPGGVYFVRDPGYDFPQVAPRMRTRIRRGLEQCAVRRISLTELYEQGLPLNRDTLQRQHRSDPFFTEPARWARFCQAAAECPVLHVWGAFAGHELAAYSIVLQIGTVVTILYQMSRTALLPLEANPALNFAQTFELMRTPGITAVSFGHVGLDTTAGLDRYKRSLGYQPEPLTFVVQLRPGLRPALLNPASSAVVAQLRRRFPHNHLVMRLAAALTIAAASAQPAAGVAPAWAGAKGPSHAG